MNRGIEDGGLGVEQGKVSGRRRVAPKIIESSDVTRFYGVVTAGFLALLGVGGAFALTVMMGTELAPTRRLERPHVEAGIECEKCHEAEGGLEPANACLNCHGAVTSTRTAHAALLQDGTLGCVDCHDPHEGLGGVAILRSGEVLRYGPGSEQRVEIEHGFRTDTDLHVPTPPMATCRNCHDLSDGRDPLSTCVLQGQGELGGQRPTVCFDEHRGVRSRGAADHVAAWDVARRALEVQPRPPESPTNAAEPSLGLAWLGGGGILGLFGFITTRTIRRRRRRPPKVVLEVAAEQLLPAEVKRLPTINTATCIGCSACVDACPYDVLEVRNYVAHLARPDDCCGLTLCEQRCPNGSLVITQGEPIEDRPNMSRLLESVDSPGIYVAGDLTGLPLIKNAINQGAYVIRNLVPTLTQRGQTQFDVVIVGSGPAGLSASLEAKSQGLNYLTLEQGSVAESIRSFPRGKLVFDQPLSVPLVGDLWLAEATKEELLEHWTRILQMHQLEIREGVRVTGILPVNGGPPLGGYQINFVDRNAQPGAVTAARVVLAFGRRGSPRKLKVDVPVAAQNQVFYSMADARSFSGARVLVVGLGDVAMEAAIGLAAQTGTQVFVSYRGADFKRGKRRNVDEVKRLAKAGRIELLLQTEIRAVQPNRVWLEGEGAGPGGARELEVDAVFVMIGSIAPWSFMESCGVSRVKVPTPTQMG